MTGYEYNDRDSIPGKARNFSLDHSVQVGPGVQGNKPRDWSGRTVMLIIHLSQFMSRLTISGEWICLFILNVLIKVA
jgi:hypothetical protein